MSNNKFPEIKCPKCGSTNITTTAWGWVEKSTEAVITSPLALGGKFGQALKKPSPAVNNGLVNFAGKMVGTLLDGIGTSIANGITKNVQTERKCKNCGHCFHAAPRKGWYEDLPYTP